MRGDRVEIVIDVGGGATKTYEMEATKAGRRLDIATARGMVEVSEVTRTGEAVRTGRFLATRVVALIEHPSPEAAAPRSTRRRSRDQPSLL
ncbi:MAG: hypothetical protein ABR599_08420 [Gemmatimonadota bacterium]